MYSAFFHFLSLLTGTFSCRGVPIAPRVKQILEIARNSDKQGCEI